jgi:Rap1a immunity proteins
MVRKLPNRQDVSKEWIEFRVKYEGPDTLPLAAIQARAPHRLQDVIDEETKRLQALQKSKSRIASSIGSFMLAISFQRSILAGITALAAHPACAAEDTRSGNYLLEACRLVAQDATVTYDQSFKVGICLGEIEAVSWFAPGQSDLLKSCPPPMAPMSQMAKVIVAYFDRHPSELHHVFLGLALDAFREAWPCPK